MPIYDYKCLKCKTTFEISRSMTDISEVSCPRCQGTEVKRLYVNISFLKSSEGMVSENSLAGGSSCSACTSPHCSSCS